VQYRDLALHRKVPRSLIPISSDLHARTIQSNLIRSDLICAGINGTYPRLRIHKCGSAHSGGIDGIDHGTDVHEQITSHHITSYHITSHHITLHYITSHHITLQLRRPAGSGQWVVGDEVLMYALLQQGGGRGRCRSRRGFQDLTDGSLALVGAGHVRRGVLIQLDVVACREVSQSG